jgi:hypothetical protein
MNDLVENKLGFIRQFRQQMQENEIMLSYKGEISQQIILALIEMTEKKLESSQTERGLKTKIFNVMIGCLQNITFHAEKNEYFKKSMFTIGRQGSNYAIYSGNAIRNDRIPELKSKLDRISKMDEADLNEFYKFWLQTREMVYKKGIGLGLIDIARKTGNDLDYDFQEIDENYSYFALRTIVKPKK